MAVFSFLLTACPGVGLILCVVTLFLSAFDLRAIEESKRSPEGEGMTRAAWIVSFLVLVLNLALYIGCFVLLWDQISLTEW